MMTHRFYRMCGLLIRVSGASERMYSAHGLLEPFAAEPGEPDFTVTFEEAESLPEPEGECLFKAADRQVYGSGAMRNTYFGSVAQSLEGAYMRVRREGTASRVQLLYRNITPRVALTAMEAERLTALSGSFLLHASFVRWKDRAILFTAPSGTGKSTQAELWCRYCGAELINGDRAIVRVERDGIFACGVPYCGSSGVSKNVTLPLAAIVYLSQAPETSIGKLGGYTAFRRLWEGCSVNVWDREELSSCSQTVLDTVAAVPVYHLACRPDQSAVDALKRLLEKE